MSFNGSGTFVVNSAGQPVVANTVISATVFNALTADLATGLSTCITKDGQTTVTANIPFGNNKITALGAGTAASDAANLGQVQSTAAKLVTVTGTDTITGTMSPALTAYAAGQLFYFIANAANTGAVTINIDGLGAKSITRDGSTALTGGDINSGEFVVIIYDGTRFQMINAANSFGNTTINGTLTVTGNTALQANVSITSTLSVGGTFAVTGAATLGSTLAVTGKSDLPTVSTASINAAVALITTGTVTNLTASGASIASANIGNLQFTAASIASINAGVAVVTNLTATSASIASMNAGVALLTTATVTSLTATGASVASANVGTAVITGMTVTGASIASLNAGVATLSGNLTLNGGTANGVLYLNGSKVATSGGALTFDGTTLTSNGGFKAAGSASSLAVDGAILDFNASSTRLAAGRAGGNFSGFELYVAGASGVTKRFDALYDTTFRWFDSAGTGELMRLTSTGLGIGTASPSAKIHAVSAVGADAGSFSDGSTYTLAIRRAGSTGNVGLLTGTSGSGLAFGTNNVEVARFDASGNLGLGVTPSASTTYKNVQNGNAVMMGSTSDVSAYWNSNATFNSGWKYISNGTAARYEQTSLGGHAWFTAASGTAGNAITFTQAMTLDASGRLGIGTTSPGQRLVLAQAGDTLAVLNNTTANYNSYIGTYTDDTRIGNDAAKAITFYTNGSERARITSGGDLLVGTTSSILTGVTTSVSTNGGVGYAANNVNTGTLAYTYLQLGNANSNNRAGIALTGSGYTASSVIRQDGIYMQCGGAGGITVNTEAAQPIYFCTNNTERARITSDGDVIIGDTTASGRFKVKGAGNTSATNAVYVQSSDSELFIVRNDGRISTGATTLSPYNNTTGSAANLFVDANGILFRSTSSLKYKTDVQDATHGLAEVMQLRAVTYKGKNDGDTVFGGFIAEEVHAAGLTEFVQYAEDGSPDALAYGNMIAVVVKAMQEQQAMINELKAKIAALENK